MLQELLSHKWVKWTALLVLLTGGVAFLLGERKTSININESGKNPDALLYGTLCLDSDENETEGGIYTPGTTRFINAANESEAITDSCVDANTLNEGKCIAVSGKIGVRTGATATIRCPAGCKDGACISERSSEFKSLAWDNSSPLTWREGGATFSLTGVSMGRIPAPSDLHKLFGDMTYREGEEVYAVRFEIKIETGRAECVPVNLKRILNEDGDVAPANTKQFIFENGSDCAATAGKAYEKEYVWFVVPAESSEYLFTTGGSSNIYFNVRRLVSGEIEFEKVPLGAG